MHHDTLDLKEAFNQIKLKWNFNLTKQAEAACARHSVQRGIIKTPISFPRYVIHFVNNHIVEII